MSITVRDDQPWGNGSYFKPKNSTAAAHSVVTFKAEGSAQILFHTLPAHAFVENPPYYATPDGKSYTLQAGGVIVQLSLAPLMGGGPLDNVNGTINVGGGGGEDHGGGGEDHGGGAPK